MRYAISLLAAAQTSTAKTAILLIPGSTKPVKITEIVVSPDAAVSVLVELVTSTQATNGTAGTDSSGSIIQTGDFVAGTTTAPECGCRTAYTSEPTVLTRQTAWRFNGQWPLIVQYPLDQEPQSLVSGSTDHKAIGLRITSASSVNCDVTLKFKE